MSKGLEALRELNYMLADKDNFYSVEEKQTTYNIAKEAIEKANKYDEIIELYDKLFDEATKIKQERDEALKRIDELEQQNKKLIEKLHHIQQSIPIENDEFDMNHIRENMRLKHQNEFLMNTIAKDNDRLIKEYLIASQYAKGYHDEKYHIEQAYNELKQQIKVLKDGVKVLLNKFQKKWDVDDYITIKEMIEVIDNE